MKTQNKKRISEDSIESKVRATEPTTLSAEAKKLAEEAVKQSWDQLFANTGAAISEQFFGSGSEQNLQEGQEITLSRKQAKAQSNEDKPAVSMEHMEYFRTTVENADRAGETKVEVEVRRSVDEIRMEIKKLIQTSKIVERTVKDSTADKAPVKPGKYHLSFFEFVLGVIRDATRKLEDTANLGSVFTSKKQQSKYWNAYKKHGTSFGLSGERTTATQTG